MNINIMCFPTNQIKIILIRRYWSNSYELERVYYSAVYAINKNNQQVVVSARYDKIPLVWYTFFKMKNIP